MNKGQKVRYVGHTDDCEDCQLAQQPLSIQKPFWKDKMGKEGIIIGDASEQLHTQAVKFDGEVQSCRTYTKHLELV